MRKIHPSLALICPVCSAQRGERCEMNSGQVRFEPHSARPLITMETAIRDRIAIHRVVTSMVRRSHAVNVTVRGYLPHLTMRIRVDSRDTVLLINSEGRATKAFEGIFTRLKDWNGFAYLVDVGGIAADDPISN